MFFYLLILFTVIPVAEISLLIRLGSYIGFFNTISIILLTGILGAYLAKTQGLSILGKINEELQNGRIPAEEMLDGVLILVGGITLLTPGFITDFIGFLLLIPLTRQFLKKIIKTKLSKEFVDSESQNKNYIDIDFEN